MSRTLPDVDELDLAILRRMYRNGLVNLAGIDPRLNATRVAQALGTGRARVAARLRAWKESGFLRHYSVWLNPAYIGWHGAWVTLRVDRSSVKADVFQRAGWVDGVVSGMEFLGDWISLGVVAPDASSLGRRVGLLRNLVGVIEAEPPFPWQVPEPRRSLSSLDLRIVRALRERPTATLSAIAHRVGISTRTMTRRYSGLIEDWAVWFVPIFDFRRLARPIVSLTVQLSDGEARASVLRRVRAQFPLLLESASSLVGLEAAPNEMFVIVTLPSAAVLEELEHLVRALPGVDQVEANVIVRMYDFPEWFDRHLEAIATASQKGWAGGYVRSPTPTAPSARVVGQTDAGGKPRRERA